MIRCAIYIRVSTEEQKMNGLSVDTQRGALTEYAKNNNMEIVDYYVDAGLTARKRLSHRKELHRLLEDVKRGLVDIIIFTKLDRWFRNISDYYKVQEILDKHKINWKTIFENYDTSTANGRLHINIMLSVAQDEADRTSERIKVVFENKRAKGETPASKAPLGYKIIQSKLLINEETKQIALDIFNHYNTHHSITKCIRMAKEKHDYKIYDYSIRRMFKNRIYLGEFKGYKNFCEPLIDEKLYNKINSYREVREFKNQLADGRVYLFSSLVFCKECRHSMSSCFTIQQQKHGPKEFHYYRCRESILNNYCVHNKRINEDAIEEYLLGNIIAAINEKMVSIKNQKRTKPTKQIDISKIKKKLDKLKDLYLDDLIDKNAYKIEYKELTAQLNCANDLPQEATEKYEKYTEQDLIETYKEMTRHEQKVFWLGVIDKIIVDHENKINFVLRR